ncbi:MAG: hypothetical protein ACRC62_02955 [Microcoleus sp.]
MNDTTTAIARRIKISQNFKEYRSTSVRQVSVRWLSETSPLSVKLIQSYFLAPTVY